MTGTIRAVGAGPRPRRRRRPSPPPCRWTAAAAAEKTISGGRAPRSSCPYAPLVKQVAPAVVNVFQPPPGAVGAPLAVSSTIHSSAASSARTSPSAGRGGACRARSGRGSSSAPTGSSSTNHHVVRGSEAIKVALADRREFRSTADPRRRAHRPRGPAHRCRRRGAAVAVLARFQRARGGRPRAGDRQSAEIARSIGLDRPGGVIVQRRLRVGGRPIAPACASATSSSASTVARSPIPRVLAYRIATPPARRRRHRQPRARRPAPGSSGRPRRAAAGAAPRPHAARGAPPARRGHGRQPVAGAGRRAGPRSHASRRDRAGGRARQPGGTRRRPGRRPRARGQRPAPRPASPRCGRCSTGHAAAGASRWSAGERRIDLVIQG